MYNLFRFLVRYHLFFLFILLEIFSFYFIIRNNKYQQVAFVNVANSASGKVYSTYTGINDYFYLRQMSDSLVAENAALRAQLLESKYDTHIDSFKVIDTAGRYIQNFTYLTARVIHNTVNQTSNFIYLDKGTLQGVHRYMGVISPNGVVGQITNVTAHYAAVRSVLSKDFVFSGKFKKNNYFGNLHWDGIYSTTATMEDVPKHAPAKVGDTIVTSGYSGLFPRNIMVGVINKVKIIPERNSLEVSVRLSTDFSNLHYVYLVDNKKQSELQVLDNSSDSIINKK